MTAAPSLIPSAETTSHQQDVLNDFVDLGHRLVRLVVEQAESGATPAVKAAPAFDRVTKSVRRCILLIRHLAEPIKTIDRVAARKRIIRTVEDTIQRETDDPDAETLRLELLDRLDTLDLENEIANRPIEDIIQDIVHDLGLSAALGTHPWKRRTPLDLAQLAARAAEPTPRPRSITSRLARASGNAAHPPSSPNLPSAPHPHVGCNSS